jgi:hypothetical protein
MQACGLVVRGVRCWNTNEGKQCWHRNDRSFWLTIATAAATVGAVATTMTVLWRLDNYLPNRQDSADPSEEEDHDRHHHQQQQQHQHHQQQHHRQNRANDLRGNERREMHERLRRQMLGRALHSDSSDAVTVVHSNQHPSRNDVVNGTTTRTITPDVTSSSSSLSTNLFRSALYRLSKVGTVPLFWRTCVFGVSCVSLFCEMIDVVMGRSFVFSHLSPRASSSYSYLSNESIYQVMADAAFHWEGPHETVRNGDNTQQLSSPNYSMAVWLVRLHLAQYLITGSFPTFLHRILGLHHEKEQEKLSPGSSHTASYSQPPRTDIIPFRPNTNRVIALLIVLQASGLTIRYVSNWLAKRLAMFIETTKTHFCHRDNTTPTFITSRSQLKVQLEKYFSSPSTNTDAQDDDNDDDDDDDDDDNDNEDRNVQAEQSNQGVIDLDAGSKLQPTVDNHTFSVVCVICRTERRHPAAPASCGHVCCWACLNEWVSNVRPECPLCRAPCRPENIIALHHYEPASNDTEGTY